MAHVLFITYICILYSSGKQFFIQYGFTFMYSMLCWTTRVVAQALNTGDLKLDGDSSTSDKVLKIYLSGQWGTISYANFSKGAADVACHQLGYSGAVNFRVSTVNSTYVPTLRMHAWCPLCVCASFIAALVNMLVSRARVRSESWYLVSSQLSVLRLVWGYACDHRLVLLFQWWWFSNFQWRLHGGCAWLSLPSPPRSCLYFLTLKSLTPHYTSSSYSALETTFRVHVLTEIIVTAECLDSPQCIKKIWDSPNGLPQL